MLILNNLYVILILRVLHVAGGTYGWEARRCTC